MPLFIFAYRAAAGLDAASVLVIRLLRESLTNMEPKETYCKERKGRKAVSPEAATAVESTRQEVYSRPFSFFRKVSRGRQEQTRLRSP